MRDAEPDANDGVNHAYVNWPQNQDLKSVRLQVGVMELPQVPGLQVPQIWTQHEMALEVLGLCSDAVTNVQWYLCTYRFLASGHIWLKRACAVNLEDLHAKANAERALRKVKRSLQPRRVAPLPAERDRELRARFSTAKVVPLPARPPRAGPEAASRVSDHHESVVQGEGAGSTQDPLLPLRSFPSIEADPFSDAGFSLAEAADDENTDDDDDDVLLVQETWRDAQDAYEQRQSVHAREDASQPRVHAVHPNRPARQARAEHWGCAPWTIARIYRNVGERQEHVGWGATCGCHSDSPQQQHLVCKKALFASASISLEAARCLVKAWLLHGLSISRHAPGGRTQHVAVNARNLRYESDAAARNARAPL